MDRGLSVVYTTAVFTFASAASGCSGASSPVPAPHVGAADRQMIPQSPGSWTVKAQAPTDRAAVAASVVDGIVYVMGGAVGRHINTLATVEAYDHKTNTWTTKQSMSKGRFALGAGVIHGKIYAVGGEDGSFDFNTL